MMAQAPTPRMIRSLLIANRGEIACRVARTARRMGIETIAVYSEADAAAMHVAAADRAIAIGPAAARESYLNIPRIIDAAKRAGAEAIHPGYGFLSENPEFVEACDAAGIVFVGPPASAMRAMGSKGAAKALMEGSGVPLLPGYHGADQDPAFLAATARKIGFPVVIKAVAGGGGRGMRVVEHIDEFAAHSPPPSRKVLPRSAMRACWWNATSPAPATSKSRSSPTGTATPCTCSSATAPPSAGTRK